MHKENGDSWRYSTIRTEPDRAWYTQSGSEQRADKMISRGLSKNTTFYDTLITHFESKQQFLNDSMSENYLLSKFNQINLSKV